MIAVAAGAVTVLASSPAVAFASPQKPASTWDPSEIVAFSDTNFGPNSTEYAPYDLQQIAAAYCKGKGDQSKVPSLGAALKIADNLVSVDTHGKGLAAFAKSKYGHTESMAIGAAAAELASGRPAIALDALLRAHQLAPNDAAPLIDAAPLLTQAGKAQAALKLLAAAQHLKMPKLTPFGVSFTALLENNEGQALLGTHQFAKAVTELTKASGASSVLRESRQLLTAAYLCTNNKGQAGKFLIAGTFRQNLDAIKSGIIDKRDPNPVDVLDTANGKTLELPNYAYPATLKLGASELQLWGDLQTDLLDNVLPPLDKKLTSDEAALTQAETHWNSLTKARTSQILADVNDAPDIVPELVSLNSKALKAEEEIDTVQLQGVGESGCLNPDLHGQYLSAVKTFATDERAAAAADYKMETAFASNLRNATAHRIGDEIAEREVIFNVSLLISAGQDLVGYDATCNKGNPATPPDSVSSGDMSTPAGPACPSDIPHLNVDLIFASFSISCESVSAEVSSEEGFFVSTEHNFKTGNNTVFVGGKVDVGVASAHAGAFVTFDSNGNPVDGGLRGTTDVTLGKVGPVSVSVDGPSGQIGIAGGPSLTLPGDPSPE
jgi:hypothetical protein